MTTNQINQFREVLEARLIELGGSARRRDAIAVEGTADNFDRGLRAADREFAVRNLEVVFASLRETRVAPRRIQKGTYGICVECEEPIRPARLAALPSAALCVCCQQAKDCDRADNNDQPVFLLAA